MSYCRFSTNNFKCDLYCYESEEGFVTHVACYRHRIWFRLFNFLTDKRLKIMGVRPIIRLSRAHLGWPRWITHKKINLKHAGETLLDETEEEMFETINKLKRLGFNAPNFK